MTAATPIKYSNLDDWAQGSSDGQPGPSVANCIKWCMQRLPKPLVEYWCGTETPSTIQHLHLLRTAIGNEEFGYVMCHQEKHLEYGNLAQLATINRFNDGFEEFLRFADRVKKNPNVSSQERAALEVVRIETNAMVGDLGDRYRKMLSMMNGVRNSKRNMSTPTLLDEQGKPMLMSPDLQMLLRRVRHSLHCPDDMRGKCMLGDQCVKAHVWAQHAEACEGKCEYEEQGSPYCAQVRQFLAHYNKCKTSRQPGHACTHCVRALALNTACTDKEPVQSKLSFQKCSDESVMVSVCLSGHLQTLARKRNPKEFREAVSCLLDQGRAKRARPDDQPTVQPSEDIRFSVCGQTGMLTVFPANDTVGVPLGMRPDSNFFPSNRTSTATIVQALHDFKEAWKKLPETVQERMLDKPLSAASLATAMCD